MNPCPRKRFRIPTPSRSAEFVNRAFTSEVNIDLCGTAALLREGRHFAARRSSDKLGPSKESGVTGFIDPTKETFAAFRAADRQGPIHMLNLVRLRERASYPDGRSASGAEALCGLRT
jgi:hypothetical protein